MIQLHKKITRSLPAGCTFNSRRPLSERPESSKGAEERKGCEKVALC